MLKFPEFNSSTVSTTIHHGIRKNGRGLTVQMSSKLDITAKNAQDF